MSLVKSCFLGVVLLAALVSSKSIGNNEDDVVYFPNPNGDGTLIPAKLTPTVGAMAGSVDDIHFYLFSKSNKVDLVEIDVDDVDSIDNAIWQENGPVKILVHGFGAKWNHTFPLEAKNAFVRDEVAEDYNVIIMEWSILSASPDYFSAVANAQIASEHCANLLNNLVEAGKVAWENTHVIGYSLGGQVVGQIGYRVQNTHRGKIARITSLDPALPLFDVASHENKTSPDDADFVDVIHTAANGILGYYDPLGHVDFYPNGGRFQPGCGIDITGSCGHGRAPACFIESISAAPNMVFEAVGCDSLDELESETCAGSKVIMGQHVPTDATGIYYLRTNSESPYSQGPSP